MRLCDIFLSFPMLPIAIVIVAMVGPNTSNVIMIAALLSWPGLARIVRGQYLTLREEDFTQAARAVGVGSLRIAFRHLLPNAMAPIIVWATLNVAQVILLEAGLSFLGLGVQIPTATWGNMLTDAQSIRVIESFPWIWIPPGIMILLTVLSINLLGDGLRDALDPSLRR
jgi:peptide/nickel transport system permease protein